MEHSVTERERARMTQRLDRADEGHADQMQHERRATKPPDSTRPTRSEPACHAAVETSATPTASAAAHFTQSMRAAAAAS
jgi:hypothetical protein